MWRASVVVLVALLAANLVTSPETARTATYDTFGNLTALPGEASGAASTVLTYDLADHLTSLDGPSEPAVTFTIDALGRSRTRQVGTGTAETLHYLGTGDAVVRIGGGSTPVDAAIDPAGTRLATRQAGGSPSFLLPDLHGNVAALWDQSSSAYGATFRYDPYGELLSSPPGGSTRTPWRYQGRLLEGEAGDPELYDFGFRSYAADLGAFASLDSVKGGAQDVISLNRFLYANANPTTLIDPTGHVVFLALLAPLLVGAVIGGASDAAIQQVTTGTIDWGGVAMSGAIGSVSGGAGAAGGAVARSALSSVARPVIRGVGVSATSAVSGVVAEQVAASGLGVRDDWSAEIVATGTATGMAGDLAFEGASRLVGRWGRVAGAIGDARPAIMPDAPLTTPRLPGSRELGEPTAVESRTSAIPNRWGRHGSPEHQAPLVRARERLEQRGWALVSGGGSHGLPETGVRVKGRVRFADLVMEKDGRRIAIQSGRRTVRGSPVARERRALAGLRLSGQYSRVHFLGYR